MPDVPGQPHPLTAEEFADLKDEWDFHGGWQPHRDLVARLVATVEAQATQLADARAERDAALDVIGAVDAVVRHKLHIDLDTMIPEWTDRQRYAIRRARWSHPASDDLLAPVSGTPTGTHPQEET